MDTIGSCMYDYFTPVFKIVEMFHNFTYVYAFIYVLSTHYELAFYEFTCESYPSAV